MAGITALRKIQIAQETTAGTAVTTASAIWNGTGLLVDDREIVQPPDNIGLAFKTGRSYTPKLHATINLDETAASFEQLPYILSGGIEKLTTGAADGSGSGKVWTYDLSTNAQPSAPLTYSIQGGDNQRQDIAEYCYVKEFTLSGAGGEPVNVTATLAGRQATDGSFTAAIAPTTSEEIMFSRGKLYIDDTGGTMGATQKSNTWLGFELTVPTGWQEVWSGDGNATAVFSFIKNTLWVDPGVTGSLTLEHDATGEAELNKARAGSFRLLKMIWEGSTLTTAGSYTYKTLAFDAVVQYDSVPSLDEQDGNSTVKLPFHVIYSSADATQCPNPKFVVVNTVGTLP